MVKSSDAYYEYSTITNFQNTTGSSHNSEVSDNTHNLIIAISVPGFVIIAILVILIMGFILIRTKGNTLDSTVIIKANSAYRHYSYRNPDAEITPVDCIAYNKIENHNKGSQNEESTSTNDEAEYSYISI